MEVNRQTILIERLGHLEALGMPYMCLQPHLVVLSMLTTLILFEQIRGLSSELAARPLGNFIRGFYSGHVSNATRQSLPQVAHCAATHMTRKQLKQRLLVCFLAQKAVALQQINFILAT